MNPAPGSIIAGKFRLERPLAQGGMGSLQQLDVPVALKFMAPSLVGSAELVARFEREAKAAAQLRHPNVVQIFEHGVSEGLPFIAMELLEGESLGLRLRARRRLSHVETSRILGEACLALRRAHERGLVHRDLKPANIFLCRLDEIEVVKVLDFGIAKSLSPSAHDEVTQTGAVLGSPHYMSPEQARRTGRAVDHRSDLWALGVIAFRCLTGQLPFPGDEMIDVLVRVCTDAAPRPSSIAPDLGPAVDRFFEKALARDPDARFQSARDFADALAALAEQPGRASMSAIESWASAPPRSAPAPRVEDVSDAAETLLLSPGGSQPGTSTTPWPPASTPASSPGTGPVQAGTLTSAGTEIGLIHGPPRRPAWIVPFFAVSALAVIGLVVGLWAAMSGPAQEGAEGHGDLAPTAPLSAGATTSAGPSPSVAVTPAQPVNTASASSPVTAAPTPAPPTSTAKAPSATATAKSTAAPAGQAATATPTTGKGGNSGYLGKPKF